MSKKEINLFEAFAGVGSQYKALKIVAKEKEWKINSVGIIEWYIHAIIAYLQIHYFDKLTNNLKIKNINFDFNNVVLSNDSKNPISKTYLKKLLNSYNFATHTHTPLDNKNNFYTIENKQCFDVTNRIFSYIYNSKLLTNNLFDIRTVNYKNIPKNIDIFTYSFPCQDLSIQGKQNGMSKNSNTRSSLLWELERIFADISKFSKKNLPKYLLLENVKNIVGANHIKQYKEWLFFLNKIGYESKTYILNSINFGSAQNRERAFCLSILKSFKKNINFSFPDLESIKRPSKKLDSILEKNFDRSLILEKLSDFRLSPKKTSTNGIKKSTLLNYSKFNSEAYVYYPDGIGPTLTASGANSRIKIVIDVKKDKHVIRKMSGSECYKYMGFNKRDYENVKKSNLLTEEKIIYTAGNSISIEILKEIFRALRF